MVRLPHINPVPSIYLLQQYHPHELMGKGHRRKGQLEVRSFEHFIAEAQGAADDKSYIASPLYTEIVDKISEDFGGEQLAVYGQSYYIGITFHML